jgi:nucleotide-binding universal stress UspA family protein
MYGHILVALDGSTLAEQILPHVEALAAKLGSKVTLLQATTPAETIIAQAGADAGGPGFVDPEPIVEAEREQTNAYLETLTNRLRGHGLNVEHEQAEGSAGDAIVQRATTLGADLIAMTTHGRGGLGRLVFGSVADEVLGKAGCPILLVRVGSTAGRR